MKGSYVLVVKVSQNFSRKVGSLGRVSFRKGYYCYAGSAKRGIETRVARHRRVARGEAKLHWHIDYLLASKAAKIIKVSKSKKGECTLSQMLLGKGGLPLRDFGSSDCSRCLSHLYFYPSYPPAIQ